MKHVVLVDSTVSGLLAFEAAKRLGCHVTFIHQRDTSFLTISVKGDHSKIEPYLKHVDEYIRVDSLEGDEFHNLLVKLNDTRKIDALISTSEAAIVAVAREAELLGTRYPSHENLCGAVYKSRLRETLRANNVRSPDFQVLTESQLAEGIAPRLALPFVVKPTRGFSKQFSAICFTQQDFDAFVENIRQARTDSDPMIDALVSREYLVEQYVDGTLHSAEVIVQDGVVSCYATTIRFRADYNEILEMTATMPSGLDAAARDEIKAYVQQVFTALKLDIGLYHVELLRDENGPCLVEINARMMGSVAPQMYRMLTGIDPFEMLIRLHLGETIKIDDSLIETAGTVVTIASRHGGRIADSYDPRTLQPLLDKYEIEFCTAHVVPGQQVSVYTGNIGTIGHVIVLDSCPYAAAKKGNSFLAELSLLYGNELAKYTGPELA
ncbi:ATP-grasp domain-containing protein [Pseudomonas sp. N3-W]|uniref:ATP-grasp domain-containing protein n=1 Tax=Pseudomonas sp. N3-W TaxID=2975049 RepID=UPI00217DDB61|nr:ATP-grasp domain-containing protein [Pseudomonas sp. N3-W]UWF48314.1 ATP-grasp domain-containing protein [Pseudomonas sp. N3-W]